MRKFLKLHKNLLGYRLAALGFVVLPATAYFLQTYPKVVTNVERPGIVTSVPVAAAEPQSEPIEEEPKPEKEPPKPAPQPSVRSGYVAGVTIDQTGKLSTIIESLKQFPARPTTRIVFDEFVPPGNYANTVQQVGKVSDIMGEILDSFYVKDYSLKEYRQRAKDYASAFGSQVDIWEIGNEVNGEWLLNDGEDRSVVVDKIVAAYDEVQKIGGKTALTLYYNPNCWESQAHETFRWANKELPAKIKNGVDYVWLSYWEHDCNNYQPTWSNVFNKLGSYFPNAKLGIGEAGSNVDSQTTTLMTKYYSIDGVHPRYVGGVFWWYYWQDVVDPLSQDNKKPLNTIINTILS